MLSPTFVKVVNMMPEALILKITKIIVNRYLKKYANIKIEGLENIDKAEGAKIFICNHLSNSDGLVLNKLLKEKYDPTFVAGIKLSNDPITNLGVKMVKTINIKPNSADKEAITSIVKLVKSGENLVIFPEGTRSRTGAMIEGKKGILLIARLTKAAIIPMGMTGTEKLLPIAKDGDMGGEKFNYADVNIKIGEPISLPAKNKDEDKHDYDERCMNYIMKSIANLLPEEYRGVYK
ncbi:lysophospholipid acyltransferase family protein [Clostridium isatidis]|uniref:Acyl-phosphate glycerol 3-phosphate acyltransferase n=1 Tax=Clostridium isatidis TaxID=182773 RepID=A0A343JD03_9CLOT|nr:lysophospholipid acyltransferase family protein [Clostridium isatidis]ASW43411.1 acyl-phosphate glycerol 3-phosphate acyltransferase [Clostridium isatidis]NLZ33435.1 1-acyl-sn-glycerol-3-phosphate acyltransferase [Clostridiales bacterium]